MEINFRKYYQEKPTETLLQIYQVNRGKYQPAVYEEIEKILEERNVVFEKQTLDSMHDDGQLDPRTSTKQAVLTEVGYAPMIVGISSNIISYLVSQYNTDVVAAIVLTIGIRLIFLVYAIELSKRYQLKKTKWIILVLVFGGWAMIALNVAALFSKPENEVQLSAENDVDTKPETSEPAKPAIEYTHCPACLADLKGAKKCDSCDLAFE